MAESQDKTLAVGTGKKVSFNTDVEERPITARKNKQDEGGDVKKDVDTPVPKTISDKYSLEPIGDKGRSAKSMYLLRSLAQSLGFNNLYTAPEKHLESVDVEGVVNYIKSGKCSKIVTMCGAGISTSAGIPDYRSPGTGMLDILQKDVEKFGLPDAKAVYTYEYFKDNPEPYFHFASKRFPTTECAKPTASHYFIRLLDEKGLLLRNFTQNIDNLETVAGQSRERLVQVHGNYHNCYCQKCFEEYTWNWCRAKVDKEKVPKCVAEGCDGVVRPDIVMFGEALPFAFFDLASQDCPNCDLLIILGTSLAVEPFNRLCSNVSETAPRVMINKEKVGTGDAFFALMGFGSGLQFDAKDNYRDVFIGGSCDDGCYALADGLGWGEELRDLVRTEHARLDARAPKKPPVTKPKVAKTTESKTPQASGRRDSLKGTTPAKPCDSAHHGRRGSKSSGTTTTKATEPTTARRGSTTTSTTSKTPEPTNARRGSNATRTGGGYNASSSKSRPTPKK